MLKILVSKIRKQPLLLGLAWYVCCAVLDQTGALGFLFYEQRAGASSKTVRVKWAFSRVYLAFLAMEFPFRKGFKCILSKMKNSHQFAKCFAHIIFKPFQVNKNTIIMPMLNVSLILTSPLTIQDKMPFFYAVILTKSAHENSFNLTHTYIQPWTFDYTQLLNRLL